MENRKILLPLIKETSFQNLLIPIRLCCRMEKKVAWWNVSQESTIFIQKI